MIKIFVDGSEGTTGLRIVERLETYQHTQLLSIAPEKRKDILERKKMLNEADVAILCLPDEAARESVGLINNEHTKVLDTSTAHRVNAEWVYGFPELNNIQKMRIASAKRVAVPGCHATGFVALAAPLVSANIIDKQALLSCHSVTGYSGGGKRMISEYERGGIALESPRQYGLGQMHKHLKEMAAFSGITNPPVFSPIVSNFYAGMVVTIPLHHIEPRTLREVYQVHYKDCKLVHVWDDGQLQALGGFLSANALANRDDMQIIVSGNSERCIVCARFDNLGKGSSGAAIQCLNLMLGNDEKYGLEAYDA